MLVRRSPFFCKRIKFSSIDIGIKNCSFVFGYCDVDYTKIKFTSFKIVDFTEVNNESLGMQGYSNLLNKIKTYFEKICHDDFKECEMIFIEYQPPKGLRFIQEYIETKYPKKVIFVHPKQMHKYYKINNKDYVTRKKCIEYYSTKYMTLNFYLKWDSLCRKHDVSDAMCMVYYFIDVNNIPTKNKNYNERSLKVITTT